VVINRSASVGHHCFLDDYASLGPGVTLTGNVWVGNGSCVGAGSVVLPDVRIGDGAIVSAGSVVRRHVRPGAVVAGNPARVIRLAAASTVLGSNQQE
jgi:acetyltransferase-like isoleucine patch superfamily enzyme